MQLSGLGDEVIIIVAVVRHARIALIGMGAAVAFSHDIVFTHTRGNSLGRCGLLYNK